MLHAWRDNTRVKILSLPKDVAPDIVRLVEKFLAVRSKIAVEHPEMVDADSIYHLPWDAKKKFGTATMNTFMDSSFLNVGVQAPAGYKYTWHKLRHGSTSAATTLDVPEWRIKDFGDWAR